MGSTTRVRQSRMGFLSPLLLSIAFANNFSRINGLGFTQEWIRGEGDEGAHPHDGLELADGKGFVAIGSKGTSQMISKRVDTEGNKVWSVHKGNHKSCGQAVLQIGNRIIVGGGIGRGLIGAMQATLWQPDTLTASRAGVSSSMKKAAPWSGPSTLR